MAASRGFSTRIILHIILLTQGSIPRSMQAEAPSKAMGKHYADMILTSVDTSKDKCKDFYGYACRAADAKDGGKTAFRSRLLEGLDRLVGPAIDEIEKTYKDRQQTASVNDAMVQMMKFYRSCQNRHSDDVIQKSIKAIKELLHEVGLPIESEDRSQSSTVFSAIVRLSLIWGVETPLLNFKVKPGLPGSVERIVIEGANMPKPRNPKLFAADPNPFAQIAPKMKTLRKDLLDSVRANWHGPAHDRFNRDSKDILEHFKMDMSGAVTGHYIAVKKFLDNLKITPFAFANLPYEYVGTFQSLEDTYKLAWSSALNFNLQTLLHITPEAGVEVKNWGFAMAFAELTMDRRFDELFRDYMQVWTVLHFGVYVGGKVERAACHILKSCDDDERLACVRQVGTFMPLTFDYFLSTLFLDGRTRKAIFMNVVLNQALLAKMIHKASWVPSESKAMMVHKLAAMMVYIGHPPHLKEARGAELRIVLRRILVQNILHVRKSNAEYRLTAFYRKFTRQGMIWSILEPPTKREAYYDPGLNAIVVPSIYGLAPYYAHLGSDVPGVFDAASMGLGIAKALAHAFDLDRGAYNEWGELVRNAWRLHNEWGDRVPAEKSWLKHFIAEIHRKRDCYVELFGTADKYQDMQSPDDIQADVIAFDLLRHARNHWKALRTFPVLPGLNKFTNDQQAYIAAAIPYCLRQDEYSAEIANKSNEPLQRLRFNTLLSTVRDFASTFNCGTAKPKCSFFLE